MYDVMFLSVCVCSYESVMATACQLFFAQRFFDDVARVRGEMPRKMNPQVDEHSRVDAPCLAVCSKHSSERAYE